jgi:hypothetical protein
MGRRDSYHGVRAATVTRIQWFGQHVSTIEAVVSVWSVRRKYNEITDRTNFRQCPCGRGVEYLYREPASHRRRRKGKPRTWDSKIWSQVPRDSYLRKTALARASSIYKIQTRPIFREGAPQKQDSNCQTVINIWSWAPDGARHQYLLTRLPSVTMWLWLWLWQISVLSDRVASEFSVGDSHGKFVVWRFSVTWRFYLCVIFGVIWSATSRALIALHFIALWIMKCM